MKITLVGVLVAIVAVIAGISLAIHAIRRQNLARLAAAQDAPRLDNTTL